MYLIPCPVCASFVSHQADRCPHCRHPIRRAHVRQRLGSFHLGMLAVGITLVVVPGLMLARDWERVSRGKWLTAGLEASLKNPPSAKTPRPARP
jgi:hypothetical protein